MSPFSPLKLGELELPNRLIMAPIKTSFGSPNGEVTFRHEAFYRRRAEGGVGAIITEPLYIDVVGREYSRQLGISAYQQVHGLRRLVDVLHESGTAAIAHLDHAGGVADPVASKKRPEAPSAIKCGITGFTPSSMSEKRIEVVIREFAGSAKRAVEAGFDAIELQFGHGYLVSQFLSPLTNARNDEFGGDWESRTRFVKMVLKAVRSEVGSDYPIIAQITADERVNGGMGIDDALSLADSVVEGGACALHVVSGTITDSPEWYYQHMRLDESSNLNWASIIKKKVSVPVFASGRLGDPAKIRSVIAGGTIDAIALGRPLLADPDLPHKMTENADADVVQCGACLQGCLMSVEAGECISCIANPGVGREFEQHEIAERVKKVVIVGGGPAGMQAALTAHGRGHDVVLFEKRDLGGQFSLSYVPPGKRPMKKPLSTLIHWVKQSGVNLKLQCEATVEAVTAERPDVVIVATGGEPSRPNISGLGDYLTGEDILTGQGKASGRVLIVGGGRVGLECSELLSDQGHDVTVVDQSSQLAHDWETITRTLALESLEEHGVKIMTETRLVSFSGSDAVVEKHGQNSILGPFDTVVVAIGNQPVESLGRSLKGNNFEVKVIGDASSPRRIIDAVREGYESAIDI